MVRMTPREKFVDAYINCALEYTVFDLAPITHTKMVDDCNDFWDTHKDIIEDVVLAGHDFWLTRNHEYHHGAGFLDESYPEEIRKILTQASYAYGEFTLYVEDDNLIYQM